MMVEKDALVTTIKTERERHRDLSGEQMVFNVRCTCGHVGQQVSVRGEFGQHVDEAVADAVLEYLNSPSGEGGMMAEYDEVERWADDHFTQGEVAIVMRLYDEFGWRHAARRGGVMDEKLSESDGTEVTLVVGNEWPTPNACRRAAEALDTLTPARFGDILRAYADSEDARFAAHGPVDAIRRRMGTPPGGGVMDEQLAESDVLDTLARALAKADGKVWWTEAFPAAYRDQASALLADGWVVTPPREGA